MVCDLAETYGILDYRSLPARLVATLFVGLGHNSRVAMKANKTEFTTQEILLASIIDRLSLLIKVLTQDKTGVDSVLDLMVNPDKAHEAHLKKDRVFASGEEFLAEWNRITQSGKE